MSRSICACLCALTLAAFGCSESFKPDVSTETGNPPAIDSHKIALVVTQDEVHVRGEAGAITPPEADVEVTIVRTQDVTRGEVEDDGSFDVRVQATIDDVFEVRAVLDGERSGVVIVDRGSAMVGEGDGGSLTCDQLRGLSHSSIEAALAMADRSCEVDADCMPFYYETACSNGCSDEYFSADGLQSIQQAISVINESVCVAFEENDCVRIGPDCPAIDHFPSCNAGQCEAASSSTDCDGCLELEVAWRVTSPGILPALPSQERHALGDCDQLVRTAGTGSCQVTVPQCTVDAPASIEAVKALIATDEVQGALTQGGAQGEPEEEAGFWYEITVGQRQFTYRTCAGSPAVTCLPSGPVQELIALLEQVQEENACSIETDACTAPFDSGPCDAAIDAWWHDPMSGTCTQQTWGGCDGNANRYGSKEECTAACPAPTGQGACPNGRTFAELVCTSCGPFGPCLTPENRCLAACTVDEDCEAERVRIGESRMMNCYEGACRVQLNCL